MNVSSVSGNGAGGPGGVPASPSHKFGGGDDDGALKNK